MALTITDSGDAIKLDYGSGVSEEITKVQIRSIRPMSVPATTDEDSNPAFANADYVSIIMVAGSEIDEYKIKLADVTSPSVANLAALLALLSGMLGSGYVSVEILTINSGSGVQTLTVPDSASYAIITVEAGAIADSTKVCRYWIGTDPTAANGHLLGDRGAIDIETNANLDEFRVLAQDAINSKLMIQYYK